MASLGAGLGHNQGCVRLVASRAARTERVSVVIIYVMRLFVLFMC